MKAAAPIPYAFLNPGRDFLGETTVHDLPDAGDSFPLAGALTWTPPLQTHRLGWRLEPEAVVLPVGVVSREGWLSDCVQYLPLQWPHAAWMQQLAGYRLEASPSGTVQLVEEQPQVAARLEGRWCVLNDIVAHRNLAHWFADLLPQLVAIRQLRQRWPDLQLIAQTPRYSNLALLQQLLLEGSCHPRPPAGRLQVEELVLQPLAFNGGVGFLGQPGNAWWLAIEELRQGLQLLRQALAPDSASTWRGHWVCFSRDLAATTEAPQGRWFSNYPQLLEQLTNAGVLVIDPGRIGIRELQLVVAQARGFVGIHGAGLMNALLGRPGARLVEIRPACGCWRMLELLARSAGLDWQGVTCAVDPRMPERSVIPIEAVLGQVA